MHNQLKTTCSVYLKNSTEATERNRAREEVEHEVGDTGQAWSRKAQEMLCLLEALGPLLLLWWTSLPH